MTNHWDKQAELIATVVDLRGPFLWLVELGAGRQVVASIPSSLRIELENLSPGDSVRIKLRVGNKTPRIIGYSDVDRAGRPATRPR